jgi:hypothetical protein
MTRQSAAIYVPIFLLALAVIYGFWGFSYDDNFITYRYAWNVLDGEGLVFNPGERVLGTSAPGYALLLAALAFLTRPLGVDIPHWGTLIAVASINTVAFVLAGAVRRDGRRLAWTPGVAFAALALTSHFNLHLLGGEPFPVLALIVVAGHFLFVSDRGALARGTLAGLLVGAAMCLRLDAGLAALIFGLVVWGRDRRFPVAYAASGIAVLSSWLIFLYIYFGSALPNTFGGKTALREVPYTLRQWQTLVATLGAESGVFLLVVAALGLGIVTWKGRWRHPMVHALGLWVVGHEVIYRMIGVWFAPWYHVYFWHAVLVLFTLGALGIARSIGERLGDSSDTVVAVVLVLLLAGVLVPSLGFVTENWRQPPDPRFRLYYEVAKFVQDHVDPGSEVLAMEIGVLGYFGERRILDLGALVSPRFTEAKFTDSRPQLVAELQPTWIVAGRPDPLMSEVLAEEGIRGHYEEMGRFTEKSIGAEVRVLRRKEARE